jgi:glutathione S-transferase
MRARLALAISGRRYELREVILRAKPTAMLSASPKGTVPVLVLPDGKVIDESLEIMRWTLTGCDPEGWLDREDAALIWASDGRFKRDLDRYKYPDRHSTNPLTHREQGLMFLRELEARLSVTDQLGGSARGLTDAAIMPFVRQFAAVDAEWFNNLELPHLRTWLQWHLDSELFNSIMVRGTVWSEGSPPNFFPC